jgi:hypothetical protein
MLLLLALAAAIATMCALTFAGGASAEWYAGWHFGPKEVYWTQTWRWSYANYAGMTNQGWDHGYVCASGRPSGAGWKCNWDNQTTNWGYWSWGYEGCQNGNNYGVSISCYDYDGR